MKRSIRFAVLIFGLATALSAGAEIYKWKDKDGKVHFSDVPPGNVDARPVNPRRTPTPAAIEPEPEVSGDPAPAGENAAKAAPSSKPASPPDSDQEFRKRRAAAAEARARAEEDAARAERNEKECQRARLQYDALASGQRIVRPAEGGGRRYIDEEERAAELKRAQELIGSFCSGR